MKQQPSYYANIPATVRYDNELTSSEKLMYGELTALTNKYGYSWASNRYFSELYEVSKVTVSRWVSKLEQKGYVTLVYKNKEGSKEIDKRLIYINDTPLNINDNTPKQKSGEGVNTNVKPPINTNVKDNNTSINNTSINSEVAKEEIPYKEIIEHLNEKTDKKISFKTKGNRDLIKARWNEGYSLDDFKRVIDNKVSDWLGSGIIFTNGKNAEDYLHPTTLFRPKNFDKYLNQSSPNKKKEMQKPKHDYSLSLEELEKMMKGES